MTEPGQATVRIAQVQGFRAYEEGIRAVRNILGGLAGPHRVLPALPSGAFPEADVSAELQQLVQAYEQAIVRLALYATRADRGLAGLSFVARYVGTELPDTDQASAARIGQLVQRGRDAAPPVPAQLPVVDPAFQSARKA